MASRSSLAYTLSQRDFLARYAAGDFTAWDDVAKQHDAVCQRPDLRAEALAVARLLMARVHQNTQQLRATLVEAGAALADAQPPTPESELQPLVEAVGPLPIALHAFWTVVGSIQLVPPYVRDQYPDYGECSLEAEGISLLALDPLQIDGADIGYLLDEHAEGEPLFVDVCPDYLGKQHISGSGPLSIELPARGFSRLDPDMGEDEHGSLVDYLRNAFDYGGFPLLKEAQLPQEDVYINFRPAFENVQGAWGPPAERLRAKLCRGLVRF